MDFLDKLDFLIETNKINKSVLSRESGIPYTTIDAFYKKGYSNAKLSTIKRLCSYFGVTLDYFVNDSITDVEYAVRKCDSFALSATEKIIIEKYRIADDIGKAIVLRTLDIDDCDQDVGRMA
ncbi:MAG: helix-turn-helix transcriptional regulator [Lachnospiraceae bacterium]|nr:helix-turn-helix transcriptional regulator [Lachnospiraceae bacterium]